MAEELVKIPAGGVLFQEGSVGRHMFLLAEGRVQVSKERDGHTVVLAELGPGAYFGELGLLESLPRTATVTALEDSSVRVIDSAALMQRLAADPIFGLKLMQRLATVIRRLSDELTNMATESAQPARSGRDTLADAEFSLPGYL